jgi:FMN-dependent NADH-azoreductase
MKKLLYITVNSKPEELSSSKTVGRAFVNRFLEEHNDFKLEEIDLYDVNIPRLQYRYFEKRNTLINEDARNDLNEKDKKDVEKIISLCDQFRSADVYVIAAPMWSLSFPAPLKEYLDCIVQDDKTIKVTESKLEGLLNDRPRSVVYIQSSGANIPWILRPVFNKGLNYVEDIMKAMGIKQFKELLVDGTGFTEEERKEAIDKAIEEIDDVIKHIKLK